MGRAGLELREIEVPAWAAQASVGGILVAPGLAVQPGEEPEWRRTDWLLAARWYADGLAEREHEDEHGPVHSYSFRLGGWPEAMWSHAWVNRIALFLRAWAAREAGTTEDDLLGPLPAASILLTHDVDAVRKTLPNRLKQGAFHSANAARHLVRGEWRSGSARLATAIRFGLAPADYWRFGELTELERQFGRRSVFHFYGGRRVAGGGPRRWLMDPAYDPGAPRLRAELARLGAAGWTVGLHPSFDTWKDPGRMRAERAAVAEAAGGDVSFCRQHWLRFSWRETWGAQGAAGIEIDSTLGFNDRPGFRNAAALLMRPLAVDGPEASLPRSIPLILMDSHLYDYHLMDEDQRQDEMRRWLGEVAAVRGQASIVWHQRVLSPDYGWGPGYRQLLEILDDLSLEVMSPAELVGP